MSGMPPNRPSSPLPPGVYADRILEGDLHALGIEDLRAYFSGAGDLWELMHAADRIRRARFGDRVHLCSIINVKQGGCPEDCGFCAQSKHFTTHVTPEKFASKEAILQASEKAGAQGASALGLVAAVRGLEDDSHALHMMVARVRELRQAGHTEAHASLGILSEDALRRLQAAGLTEYNHNLETGRSYFGKIVSTHTYDDRIATIRHAKALGLRTCVGGIMGMGESPEHRAELAMELRELDVDEVPLNFLVSIDGTALQHVEPLSPLEMLRVIACFRLALPRQNVFIAAGRAHLGQLQPLMFSAGASGMMIGDYLTTPNRGVEEDLALLDQLGLKGMTCGSVRPEKPPMSSPLPQGRRTLLPVLQT